jgi:hypothetical protein
MSPGKYCFGSGSGTSRVHGYRIQTTYPDPGKAKRERLRNFIIEELDVLSGGLEASSGAWNSSLKV